MQCYERELVVMIDRQTRLLQLHCILKCVSLRTELIYSCWKRSYIHFTYQVKEEPQLATLRDVRNVLES